MFEEEKEEKPDSMRMMKLKELIEQLQMLVGPEHEENCEEPKAEIVIAAGEPKV